MASTQLDEKAIFNVARKIDLPEARAEYLSQVCGADSDLLQRVETLLRAYQEQVSFLELPRVPPTIDEPPLEMPGTQIGPYKLIEHIGDGGMGTVWMAQQTEPVRRLVAVKLIKAGMDSAQVIARFEAERQALALMDHPNIARVLDAGTTDAGRPYFVMDLVRGVPITRYCDEHHLTPRQRLELFIPVCQAIQHAHQKGIIHRDLKPSNVLVALYDGKPVPKVIDFGVAKATGQTLTDKTLVTGFGAIVGTLEYMSPEQAEFNQLDIDTRSDIYSLGVLLYELLTGGPPFNRKDLEMAGMVEMLRVIREQEPSKPSTKLSSSDALPTLSANRGTEPAKLKKLVRGELDWIVMKALEKDRSRRYETANGFAMDVQRYLNDEPVQACPPSAGYRLWKFARRNKGPVLAAAVVVLALVAGIIGTTWGMLRATDAEAAALNAAKQKAAALKDKEKALEAAQKSEWDRAYQLWEATMAQARASRLSRRAGQRFEALEFLQRATDLARSLELPDEKLHELRNAAIATLALPDLHLAGPWNDWPAEAVNWDFDEALAIYARTDRKGNCSVRRVADDVEIHRLPGLGGPAHPHFRHDGKFVAVMHEDAIRGAVTGVHLWQLDGETPRRCLSEAYARDSDFNSSGQQVALSYTDGAIRLFELPSGRQLSHLPPDPTLRRDVNIALHPTESVVAVYSYFGSVVQVRDLPTGNVLATLPQNGNPCSVAWHPDGQTLAVGLEANMIHLYDRVSLRLIRTLENFQAATALAFNHAGDRLAANGWAGTVELFDVGTGQKIFMSPYVGSATLRFSRDDRRLAGARQDGKLGIWQVGDSREYRTLVRRDLPDKAGYTYSMSVDRDGRLLAAAMTDGFCLWDLASGSELAFIPTQGETNGILFEPSGALLTLCRTGLFRWPVQRGSDSADQLLLGPPESLSLPFGLVLGQSQDGKVIVTCDRAAGSQQAHAGGWILRDDRPGEPIRIDAGADIGFIAVSPDARWVVTVTFGEGTAKIWDARNGRFVKQLTEHGAGHPRFSPDGKWLSTDADGGQLFAVGTWEPGPRVGQWSTFAPDSRLIAIGSTTGVAPLVDLVTGRELARLADPESNAIYHPLFTPDGTKLIGLRAIRVWDLRLVRQRLAEMDLDWKAPPYPPADLESKAARPLKVEVRLGDPAELPREQPAEAKTSIPDEEGSGKSN
jgi:serine/threonine protein kinase/WD40 repeat protein